MNRSFQSVVIAFFASILLISGCSSGSSTGVSFSRDAVTERQCFAEYVSFYDDLQVNFMEGLTDPLAPEVGAYDYDNFNNPSDPIAFDLTADYGKNHYYRRGAIEGRRLPYGCERFLRPDPRCFDSYFKQDSNGGIQVGFFTSPSFLALQAISEMEEIHGVRADRMSASSTFSGLPHMATTGYEHWITHGREEGRPVPEVLFRSGTLEALNCQGMITHQPACRSGSRFPNCNDFDLRLGTALAAAAAEAQACADRGGALNTDTNRCTIPQDPAASYTDDQILAYMNCHDDLKNERSSDAEKIKYGREHYRLFGQAEGRTCGLVAAVAEAASSSSGGGGTGISVNIVRK